MPGCPLSNPRRYGGVPTTIAFGGGLGGGIPSLRGRPFAGPLVKARADWFDMATISAGSAWIELGLSVLLPIGAAVATRDAVLLASSASLLAMACSLRFLMIV